MNNGWIKLHRSIIDNAFCSKSLERMGFWIYLLTRANHTDKAFYHGNQKVTVRKGQLLSGRKIMASDCHVSEMKISRWLSDMVLLQQIEQQTTNKYRIITILNWNRYQDSEHPIEQQMNNKRTTDEQQMNTNNNDKNEDNSTKVEGEVSPPRVDVFAPKSKFGREDVNTLLGAISKMTPTGKLDGSEKDNRRLATTIIKKYTLETALKALRNIKGSFYEGKINSARDLHNHFNALLNAKADTRRTDIVDLVSSSFKKL